MWTLLSTFDTGTLDILSIGPIIVAVAAGPVISSVVLALQTVIGYEIKA